MMRRTDKSPVATWWWTIDRWFLAAFLSLMVLGVVLSFAASPAVAERIGLDSFHFAIRQIVFMIGGASKAEALARVANGEDLPTTRVSNGGAPVTFLLDRAAAGLIA